VCIAILTEKGKSVSSASLYKGWSVNRDGAGFAYLDADGKVQIDSGYMSYNEFEKAYRGAVEKYGNNGPMLVHMRIRSAGGFGQKNCHPFRIKGGAMIHNGTLFTPESDHDTRKPDRKSDTRIFAETFHNILDYESVKLGEKDILKAVGTYNKLVFLYDTGKYHIMNEKSGYWDDGIWYSNEGCKISKHHPAARRMME
jgi:predicted glutamine amidotransferase